MLLRGEVAQFRKMAVTSIEIQTLAMSGGGCTLSAASPSRSLGILLQPASDQSVAPSAFLQVAPDSVHVRMTWYGLKYADPALLRAVR